MPPPEVTIITVTRNDYAGLVATRKSVLQLENINYEHLIIDGGSTDATLAYLKDNFPHDAWSSASDHGPYDGMNRGVQKANGQWCLFLNSGDVLTSSQNLRKLIDAATLGNATVAYGDHYFGRRLRRATEFKILHEQLLQGNAKFWLSHHPCHQATLFRTSQIQQRPYNLSYRIAADFLWLEEARNAGVRILYQPGEICEYQPNGLSKRFIRRCIGEWYKIIKLETPGENPGARAYLKRILQRNLRR